MDLTKILIETSERRVSKAPSRSALSLLKQELSGSQSEAMAIDSLLEEALSNNGLNPFDKNLISLVREYNCKDISGDLRRKIRNLLEKIKAGEDSPFHLMMLRITLRSKRKQLEKQQGSPPGTPASSDDEYEESDEFDPEHVFSNKDEEEDEDNPEDDSSNNIFERCLVSTSASLSSDSEDDEDVSPVSFINEATEQHPNSYFFDQTRKSCIISPINKEKILKAERNISHVAKAPKPFKKIVKADQVTVLDDEALQNNLKNHKNIQKIKEQNLVDPRVLEGLSMVTKRGPAIPAINNKQNRSAFKSYTTKEKMLKVDSNMLHVAKTPKSFEKNIKADQVTVTEDKALKSKLKKNKIQQNNKEKKLMDPRVKEDSSLVTIGPVIPAANISAPHPEQAAAEVFEESLGANASQKVIPEVISTEHDYGKEEKDKMRDDKEEYSCRSADLQQHKFNRRYSDNEEFLSKNCYGGGKKKSKDSDLEYDPGDAKKRKAQKRNRRKNRRNNPRNNPNRRKGDARSSKRKAAVKAANAKTNADRPKGDDRSLQRKTVVRAANAETNPIYNPVNNPNRPKGDDRSLQQKAVVQAANAKTNADRPKGDDRSLQRKTVVRAANAKTNPIYNPVNNPVNNPNRPKGDDRSLQQKAVVQAANAKTNADRPKGDDRSLQQKAVVQAANAKTNADRPKGDDRSLQQKAVVQAANAKTNADRPKGDDRSLQQKAVVQAANAKTNADRPKGDDRSLQQKAVVQAANAKTNPIYNPVNNPKRPKGDARSSKRKAAVDAANSKRPGKKLHEYDENSIHPPTLSQVHDSGCFIANAKAAACASQPPDPSRTMEFMNELIKEIRAKFILTFLSEKFWDSANRFNDDSYLELESQTMEMLKSVKLFLTYDSLDEYFEQYDCESPLSYEHLQRKVDGQSESEVRKEWLSELLKYEEYVEKVSKIRASTTQNKAESFAQVVSEWKETLRLTTFCGFNDVKRFYKMFHEYQRLKNIGCKICTVCGSRRRTPTRKLKDAKKFLHLLELTESEVERFKALVHFIGDRIGKLAQQCFHIEKIGEKYYFILDLDEEKFYTKHDQSEEKDYSLVTEGKLTKLPACKSCFELLQRRNKWASKHPDIKLDNNLGPTLPDFAFKVRDFGRIPKGLPKLNAVARSAIAPFTAFTRIRQVRNSSGIPGAAQSSSLGHSLSRESNEISGKDFFVPLTDEEFSKSFQTELPRDDIASLHRLFFMGNTNNWSSMESRLNAQNKGLTFDAKVTIDWIETLKRTQVFDEGFVLRRATAIDELERKVNRELSAVTDMNSSTGVVIDDSEMVKRMAKDNEDDVGRARQIINENGVVSSASGITSSLYTKSNESQGGMPILKAVLNSTKKSSIESLDNLILTLDKDLPNEFGDFPRITQMTFPDKFPIPVNEHTFMGSSMLNTAVRKHLCDYYDGRFCQTDFIFWLFNILTRHSEIKNCSMFFKHKHPTKARLKFEELCNTEDLESQLEYAIKNEDSEESKKLVKAFHDLISVVGGHTPWTTGERQRTLGKLYAMTNFFGLPSFFITMAPCIADSKICIDLLNNTKCVYNYELSTHEQRMRWTAENPVASAKAFHLIVDALVSTFLNIPCTKSRHVPPVDSLDIEDVSGESGDDHSGSLTDAFKRHLRRKLGCLGVPVAFYGIFEAQARAALHIHGLFWTLLNAELLSKVTQKDLRNICMLIDQLIATWIHESDVVTEQTFKKEHPSARCAHRKIPDGLSWDEVASLAKRNMFRCQLHDRCSFTCFKGKTGKKKCRLCKPSGKSPCTKFSVLKPQRNVAGELVIPQKDENINPPPEETPIPPKDTRVMWCDHKRLNDTDANLVDGNVSISAAFGWNTSINYISTPGSAQSALFYVGNYMRKPIDKSSSILPLVYSARKKQLKFPSKAKDQGSSKRNAKYLSQILLNKIHGSQEISDQIAASAVYGFKSYISSHEFVNFYPVDLYNYVKTGGESLFAEISSLDSKDFDDENADQSDDEPLEIPDIDDPSGKGQAIRPVTVKSSEEKGKVIVPVLKDIDDYLNRGTGSPFFNISPLHYKMTVSRVSRKDIGKRSSKEISSGTHAHAIFEFDHDHPLSRTHVQRLRRKILIPQFIGMQIPKHPGPEPEDNTTAEYSRWERKLRKLTNFIQAVYLPWTKDVQGFRPPLEVIAELETYMNNLEMDNDSDEKETRDESDDYEEKQSLPRNIGSFINAHIRRTIGFALSAPNVTHETKKMIQLLRHQFSRKRSKLFERQHGEFETVSNDVLDDYAEILCEAQADMLAKNKPTTRMDKHLADVSKSIERLAHCAHFQSDHSNDDYKDFSLEDAHNLEKEIEEKIEALSDSNDMDDEKEPDDCDLGSSSPFLRTNSKGEGFFDDMFDDQIDAGRYFLRMVNKQYHNNQLLMLLHGSPGTGKSFFIKRIKECTRVKVRITATSGIAAMSINGSTIDWLLDKRYESEKKKGNDRNYSRVENINKRLGDASLIIIDEVSMMGCSKFKELDALLKKAKNCDLPFGGLDILLCGDFAQLPAVKQTSLHDALVQSTQTYIAPDDHVMAAATLLAKFRKFELITLKRSKDCIKLKELLLKYRNLTNTKPSITMKDIEDIGVLDKKVLLKDPSFKNATILVATRRERAVLSRKVGQRFARETGVPVYWWYKRPSKGDYSNEEADAISQGMYKYCPDVEGYYIQGAPCMMKQNISPPLGYANGSQGRMVGIVPKEGEQLPPGAPGEMIMIEPPQYIIMEVHHTKGDKEWTTVVPCKIQEAKLEYRKDGREKKFHCRSNKVNLMFAMTIHETQGQTLKRALLLLGRLPGLHVGRVTWSLLYVALSRAKLLNHIKFFPCGLPGFHNFRYLTKLKPSTNLVKWTKTYRDHVWNPDILEKQQMMNEKNVENKLLKLGPKESLQKTNDVLIGYLKGLNYRMLRGERRSDFQKRLIMHMERKNLWKLGENKASFLSIRGTKKRKRSKAEKKSSRKSAKVLKKKQSHPLSYIEKSGLQKAKRRLSKKKYPVKKKKSTKNEEDEKLPERYLLPDELLFEKLVLKPKGYRIDPIKRDGNCLFRAVAGAVLGDTELYADVRKQCADFMEKEKEFFTPYVQIATDEGIMIKTFDEHISNLRRDGDWGGDPEITALSGIFNCFFEVYKNSDTPDVPDVRHFQNVIDDTNFRIRLFFKNKHYSIVRSDGVGDQLFNFEGLEEGELERQMEILSSSNKPKINSESELHLCTDDQKLSHALKLSLDSQKAEENYKRFYASRIIVRNPNAQN